MLSERKSILGVPGALHRKEEEEEEEAVFVVFV